MWISRKDKKVSYINNLLNLDRQVLIVHGARQVGKTSFILNALDELSAYPQLRLNALYPSSFRLDGVDYLGRDFFGRSEIGEEFLKNIELKLGPFEKLQRPALVFIDEVDRHPVIMESVQSLAEHSKHLKFVLTGSNLENILAKNAATGRKKYFDLYPISFREFLEATQEKTLIDYFMSVSLKDHHGSPWAHDKLLELVRIYIRLGGMPRLVSQYLDPEQDTNELGDIVKDLAISIEENVKTVLGEKLKIYEYEDVLRKLALLSMNTLKFTHLQVQHAGRAEAKKLVVKTVGARVAHKIRLWDAGSDLSKFILFDCGIINYLLNGSELLMQNIPEKHQAILYESFVGNELISRLRTRDDLYYWKSGNRAELEYLLRSPYLMGVDVKVNRGDSKSLHSFALMESDAAVLVKISADPGNYDKSYVAKLPNHPNKRSVPMVNIPHYLCSRLKDLLDEVF